MAETNSVVAVYDTHSKAEEAVKELQRSGFDMKKMSIVGKDYHTDEHVVGYHCRHLAGEFRTTCGTSQVNTTVSLMRDTGDSRTNLGGAYLV
jgi:hypothetical protein